jgi:hypothetical protein
LLGLRRGKALMRREVDEMVDTAPLMMWLFADHYLTKVGSLGSPGGDELRWVKPVRPRDGAQGRPVEIKARPRRGHLVRRGQKQMDPRPIATLLLDTVFPHVDPSRPVWS